MAEPPKGLIRIKDFIFRTAWRAEPFVAEVTSFDRHARDNFSGQIQKISEQKSRFI
jgi:hypothetical protein